MFTIISSGNKEEAKKLIPSDYLTINADGVMDGKENTLKTLGRFTGSTGKLSDKKIRVYNNVGIITGRSKFYMKEILVADIFYTQIWNYRNGQWLFIGWQGTMTGIPSYYPIIFTLVVLLILFLLIRLIVRKRRNAFRLAVN